MNFSERFLVTEQRRRNRSGLVSHSSSRASRRRQGKGLTISSDSSKLFHHVVPGVEDGLTGDHGLLEGVVLHVHEFLRGEDSKDLVVEVFGDGFNERESSTDGVGAKEEEEKRRRDQIEKSSTRL